ncbi:hypothetical protein [Pseudonocardia endophytica]|uniref:hypothetical protein n=1 Tax=Pseudonocardia endophytica TaxID=401976 RepID=UPI00104625BE|nr:hypothetical protein [Pseudonocardia endophytica]
MSTPSGPQDGTEPSAGDGGAAPAGPAYYRPGPSSGYYPQYPQNPYGPGSSGVPPQFAGGYPAARPQETYPYGGPFPAGTGPQYVGQTGATGRPRNVVTGFMFLLVSPALFIVVGLVLALAPLTPDMFPPETGIQEALTASGLTMEQLLSAMRTFGAVLAVLAVVYALLAVVSFLGKLGALITLTVLTVLFDLFWLLALLSAATNPIGAILPVIVLGTSIVGVTLMFSAQSRAWFAARR